MKKIFQKNNHAMLGLSSITPIPAIFLKTPLDDYFLKPVNDCLFKASYFSGLMSYSIFYEYDEDDQPTIKQTFGTTNNQSGGTEQLQNTVERTYNQLDLITQINHAGSITQYNPDGYGNTTTSTDPNNNPSNEYTYDPLYRITRLQDALAYTTQYEYNVKDQIVKVRTHNNIVTEYQYNDFGDRLQEVSKDRGTIHYQYDNASNVTQVTDGRGVVSQYSYDALNRVNSVQFTDNSENITYVYDSCTNGVGRVCQVTDPSGTTTLEYDVYGNITQQAKVELGQTYVTQYTYDDVDQISSITYPNGIQLTYQRDNRSRITDITLNHSSLSNPQSILSGVQYRADNQMAQCTLGNGVVENRAYDLQGRLTSQQLSDNLFSRNYSYDANGNILNVDSNTIDPVFEYDALNRMTNETGVVDTALSYDENSNRLTQLLNGETLNYDYNVNSNQLIKVGETAITLDGSGNTLTDGIKAFAYNDRNQLKTFTLSGSSVASYEYDYKNLRTQKQINGGDANIYRYDLQGRRIQHNTNNQTNTSTVYLGWQPVAHIQHAANGDVESITYLTTDQIGAPRLGTNQDKTVVWSWEADAFGSTEPNADVDNNGQVIAIENRLVGNYADAESGLQYNWNRYRDTEKGRYISSDRIGLDGGLNTYGYADQNPLMYIDFYGLAPDWVGPTAVTAGVTGGALVAGGFATANPPVMIAGLGLMAAGGVLQVWDWATTPVEELEKMQDKVDEMNNNIQKIQDLLDENDLSKADLFSESSPAECGK